MSQGAAEARCKYDNSVYSEDRPIDNTDGAGSSTDDLPLIPLLETYPRFSNDARKKTKTRHRFLHQAFDIERKERRIWQARFQRLLKHLLCSDCIKNNNEAGLCHNENAAGCSDVYKRIREWTPKDCYWCKKYLWFLSFPDNLDDDFVKDPSYPLDAEENGDQSPRVEVKEELEQAFTLTLHKYWETMFAWERQERRMWQERFQLLLVSELCQDCIDDVSALWFNDTYKKVREWTPNDCACCKIYADCFIFLDELEDAFPKDPCDSFE